MSSNPREYVAHGWKLCGIDAGKKAPTYDDWNSPAKALTEEEAEGADGVGLMHALSGTCALDIDNLEAARAFLAQYGVDVDALMKAPESVRISSGMPNRGKLLYRMRHPMRTLKPKDSGIELRSAASNGMSVQDVLPPTVHPIMKKPYTWVYGDPILAHWSNPPPIPSSLLAMWRQLAAETPPESTTPRPRAQDVSIEVVRKAMYQRIAREKLDVSDYNDWLKVGMALHDQTRGTAQGLELWDEWSATDDSTRPDGQPRYQGFLSLKAKWLTFSSEGKSAVSLAADVAQVPASKDEFDVEEEVSEEETTAALLKEQVALKRAEAQAELEKRLVFVRRIEKYFDTTRHSIIMTESGLRHQFTPMMPKRARGRLDPVELLKESTTKRYVEGVGFHPGEGAIFKAATGDLYANTYRNRLPAPIKPTADELEKITWLFDRITDVPYREWLLQLYAHVVQHPGIKIKSAPLIWGETQGNGKTTLVKAIPSLLVGSEYSRDVNSGLLASDHNDYLLGAWHVNLSEFRAGSRGEREMISKKVEALIADDVIPVHPKGLPGYSMPNHTFVCASSNFGDAAAIDNHDRKWGVLELTAPQFTERERQWIYHQFLLQPRAAGVLRHFFLNTPIVDFSPSASAPFTASKGEMVEASISSDVELLREAFEERSGLFARDVVMVQEVTSFVHKHTPARPNMYRVGRLLARPPFNGLVKRVRVGEGRFHVVIIRDQAKWDRASGKDVMAHIQGLDDDASVEHEPTDDELLA